MMQSPYDIGFGPWSLWIAVNLVQLLILGILAWSVVTFMRHRGTDRDRPPGTQSEVRPEAMTQSKDASRAPRSVPRASRVNKGPSIPRLGVGH